MKSILRFSVVIFCCLLGWSPVSHAQNEADFLLASIDFRPNGELTLLKAFCKNNTSAPLFLSYKLSIEHESKGNIAIQNQEGNFDIKPNQKYLVALHTMNYQTEDALTVLLEIFSAGEPIATDTLVVEPPKNKTISNEVLAIAENIIKEKQTIASKKNTSAPPLKNENSAGEKKNKATTDRVVAPQEDIGIDGLIIDETRTKMAHDFYDLFYRKWTNPKGASDFIIYIREMPSRGRIAQVALFVNDDEVVRRNLSPRFELLEQQVNLSIRVLMRHLKNKESVKESLGDEDSKGDGIF